MKEVFIHIGAEKTGTTSLQDFFRLNAERLYQAGVFYPCDENRPYVANHAHFPLAGSFAPDCPDYLPPAKHREASLVFGALLADIERANAGKILISAEHFSSRCSTAAITHGIRRWFQSYAVKVIVYLRRQDELLVSSFGTYQRGGGRKSFAECLDEVDAGNTYFSHRRMLQPWQDAFGTDKLIVRPFESERFRGDELYHDFLGNLGVPYERGGWAAPERHNCLISREASEFLQLVNARFPDHAPDTRAAWEEGQRLRAELLPRMPQNTPLETLLPPPAREAILETFRTSNDAVAATFLPARGTLFSGDTAASARASGHSEYLRKEHLVDVLIEVWREKQACAETANTQAAIIAQLRRQLAAQGETPSRPWYRRALSFVRRLTQQACH